MKFNHIILITQDFPPEAGGIQTWCVELAKKFADKEIRVTVLTKIYEGFSTEPFSYKNIVVVRLSDKNWKSKKNFRLYKAISEVRSSKSIVLCSNWKMAVPAYLFSKFHKQDYFVVCHGLDGYEKRRKNRILQRKVFQNSTGTIAVSKFTRDYVIKNCVETAISVINNGVDLNLFSQVNPSEKTLHKYGIDSSKLNILNVGRLEERKGFDYTIQAIKDIENIVFHIGGTGKYEAKLKNLVVELGINDKVVFHGFIPDEDMNELFNAIDLFVMPSRKVGYSIEGFGITYLEAAACGTPSIGGINSGAADAIEDNLSGLLVDSDSIESIRKGIQYFIDNPKELEKMGSYGMERVKKFTWELIAGQYLDLFNNNIKY